MFKRNPVGVKRKAVAKILANIGICGGFRIFVQILNQSFDQVVITDFQLRFIDEEMIEIFGTSQNVAFKIKNVASLCLEIGSCFMLSVSLGLQFRATDNLPIKQTEQNRNPKKRDKKNDYF